jgi:WD40 repeat protein
MRLAGLSILLPLMIAGAVASAADLVDRLGDPLPKGAVQRLGALRMKMGVSDFRYLGNDRAVIATGGTIEIWDLARGERQAQAKVGGSSIVSLACRRDGQAALLADHTGEFCEWGLSPLREIRRWATGQKSLRSACCSPDEKRALTTSRLPPTLKEWDLESRKELISITGKMACFEVGIYGSGRTALVGGGFEKIVECYDLSNGALLSQFLDNYHVYDMVLSSDGKRLLVGSRTYGSEWDLGSFKELRRFTGHHGGAVPSVAYCLEPDQILTGSRDGSIRRWNRLTGEVLARWFPHQNHVTRMRVSPDGRWVLSYGGGSLLESSIATGEPRLKWDRHTGPVQAAVFLPTGRQIVSGSADGTLRIWDAEKAQTLRVVEGANLGAYAVAVSPDGTKVAAGCKDGKVREFAVADGRVLRELVGHLGYVRSVAYAPDGKRLLSSADDGSIRVWAAEATGPVAVLQGHRGGVLSVAVSLDGKSALSGGRDGTVRLWDLAAVGAQHAAPLRTMEGHRGWVDCVAFMPDGQHGLSGGRDGRLLMWDLSAGKVVSEMLHGPWVHALACAPDGSRAFTVGDSGEIACWDLKTGRKASSFAARSSISSLALSPDATRLLSGQADTTLLVWDLKGP